jgi:hypothetical protein
MCYISYSPFFVKLYFFPVIGRLGLIEFGSFWFDFLTDRCNNLGGCFVKVKVGDVYIRHSDRQVCRVKWIDRTTVVLEFSEDGLVLTNAFALEKGYRKRESKPIR